MSSQGSEMGMSMKNISSLRSIASQFEDGKCQSSGPVCKLVKQLQILGSSFTFLLLVSDIEHE